MPEISVIIPVYNAEKYIRRCVDSILAQSFKDYEVILINDGSTDASLSLCAGYSEQDERVLVLNKKNGGAASARNLGLDFVCEHGNSNWICFIDIDDYVHEQYLERLLSAAIEQNTCISMCSYEVTDKESFSAELKEIPPKSVRTEALWCKRQINCTVPFSKLFKKNLFRDIRFPEGIIHEDEFTLYRVLFKCNKIAFLDLPLYAYYQTETSVMRGEWTPRHMSEPDGLLEQLSFFHRRSFRKAEEYTAKIYLYSIYRNLIRSKEQGRKYYSETKKLKKRLRIELLKYKRIAGISVNNADWLFYEAYPIATLPIRAWRKIKRLVNGGSR